MHIWTDNPPREIWNQLRYLKSPANMVNLLAGLTKSSRVKTYSLDEDLERRAIEVSCCIEQADQYFHAAQQVGLATKPLLQFYGAQSLAKAIVLANKETAKLHELRYHGLSSRASTASTPQRDGLREYADEPSRWSVEDEFAICNNGVFPQLADVAADPVPKVGEVVRFKELLRLTPELGQLYARHYNEPSHTLYLYTGPELESDGHFSVFFSKTALSVSIG